MFGTVQEADNPQDVLTFLAEFLIPELDRLLPVAEVGGLVPELADSDALSVPAEVRQLASESVPIFFMGATNAGKSTLLNVLLDDEVFPSHGAEVHVPITSALASAKYGITKWCLAVLLVRTFCGWPVHVSDYEVRLALANERLVSPKLLRG